MDKKAELEQEMTVAEEKWHKSITAVSDAQKASERSFADYQAAQLKLNTYLRVLLAATKK